MSALQAKNEARMQSMGALLFARQQARAAEQAARSAAGLVSVSTTCRTASGSSLIVGGETYTGKDQVALAWTDNVITIDPIQSRITRLRKSLGVASKALHNAGSLKQQMWMQTLTYRGDNRAWKPEHISRYLDALRKWHYAKTGSKTVRYAWVAELQDRGVIHYHIVVWLEGGLTPPKGDRPWSRKDRAGLKLWEPPMWPHGMTRRDKAYCPVAYLMKYVSKVGQKRLEDFRMALEFMAVEACLKLAVLAAVGYFGLRMCRLMLRCKTALDLRREAVTSMLRQESFCSLTSHQRAAVFIALSACGEAREGSNHAVRFPGSLKSRMRNDARPVAVLL